MGQAHHQAAHRVGNGETDVLEQQIVESAQALAIVRQCGRLHFVEDIGMATDRALAKNHRPSQLPGPRITPLPPCTSIASVQI